MIAPLVAGLIWSAQAGYSASFPDVWDRWKQVDSLWTVPETAARRDRAIPHLKVAAPLILGSRWSEACRQLDLALADLQGVVIRPESAATLRFNPPIAEPGKPARLTVRWAYRPNAVGPLRLTIGNRRVTIYPGRTLTLDVVPLGLEPELARDPELGVPVTAQLGEGSKVVYLCVLKSARARIDTLVKSPNEFARSFGLKALSMLEAGIAVDPGTSVMGAITLGEGLHKGEIRLQDLETVPHVRQGPTSLYVSFPKTPSSRPLTLVIGVSGFGGEAAFAGNFGSGHALALAAKREWAFVGATPGDTAIADALAWVKSKSGRKVARYFVIGYSRAAASAAAAGGLVEKPAAIALLAPLADAVPRAWLEPPLLLAAGSEDPLRSNSAFPERRERLDVRASFPDHEHLTLPSAAMARVFDFFDAVAGRS